MSNATRKNIAAVLLVLLVMSWLAPSFGAAKARARVHDHAHVLLQVVASVSDQDHHEHHGDNHERGPGHALEEHANLAHMLDHLPGKVAENSLVSASTLTQDRIPGMPSMSLLTTTLTPLYRPPIALFA